ncbi:MAG: type II secretion system F family protein [Nanoarchaeota archaeon]
MIKIPFSFVPPKLLFKLSKFFYGVAEKIERKYPNLTIYLNQAEAKLTAIEYLSMCLISDIFFFIFILIISLFSLYFGATILTAIIFSIVVTLFVTMQQFAYPRLIASRRVREIEKNLMPALQDILIQLNSGIPLFNILVNISSGDYGEISSQFNEAIKEINAGRPQLDALEDIAVRNPSILFRRVLWQLVNGMKEGADISSLITEVIRSVADEQLIQIQRYGGQLSPLALFYMLIAIIAPSLGVTFIIILSSFIALSTLTTKVVFYSLLVMTMFFQIMFLGMIKTRRPTLI